MYRRRQGLNPLWVLIGVNLVILVATEINPNIIYLFGLSPLSISEQPWTLVSSLFVHAGLWHLFANMLTLYFYGTYVTMLTSETTMLVTYFAGGIVGNLLFLLLAFLGLATSPMSILVGASGAVFALGGVLAVMRPSIRVYIIPIPVPLPLWIAVIGGFLILSIVPGISWQAHLGGLVYGLAVGYYFRRKETRRF